MKKLSLDISQLANYGVIGLVLAWFMLRAEKKDEKMTKAVENNTLVLEKVCLKIDSIEK